MKGRIGFVILLTVSVLVITVFSPIIEAEAETEKATTDVKVSESDLARQNAVTLLSKDKAKALQALEDIVASDKYSDLKQWATLELYIAAQEIDKVPQVIEDLKKLEASNPNNPDLKIAIAEGYVRLRDWAEVVNVYEELEKKTPDDYAIQTRLTDYYILANQFDKAIQRLEPIVNKNPDDTYHSDILANAYAAAGMQDKAIALYKKKLEKEPNSPGLVGRYAQVLSDFGRTQEALKEWQKAYQLDPTNPLFERRVKEVSETLGVSPKLSSTETAVEKKVKKTKR